MRWRLTRQPHLREAFPKTLMLVINTGENCFAAWLERETFEMPRAENEAHLRKGARKKRRRKGTTRCNADELF